jgi:hypothetical protein
MSAASKRALMAAALGGTLAVSAGAATTAHAATAAKVGASAFAKWMLLGVLATTLAVAGGLLVSRTNEPATKAAPAVVEPRVEAPAPPSAQAPAPPPATSAALPTIDPGPAPTAHRAAASASAPAVAPAAPAGDLAAEAALLDEAREAVARRDGAAALAVLAQHTKTFPRPALADEAFVLRAEALAVQGDGARLRALATPWLASHPTSPYAPRVRRAVAQASPPAAGEAAP